LKYYKYYKYLDEDDDVDMKSKYNHHCIAKLIGLILSQFAKYENPEYCHPIFEILMHFAHFGNEERALLIDLGMIWKRIAFYRKDFNGLQSWNPSKNDGLNENENKVSSKIGWKKSVLKEYQTFKALPQIISSTL
jgi:hypothetical protein